MAEAATSNANESVFHALPNMFHVAEHKRTVFVLTVPAETNLADISKNPGALASCLQRQKIEPGCRIEVHGGSEWWAELLVVHVNLAQKRVHTKVLTKTISLGVDKESVKADPLRVEKTVGNRWRVMRETKNLGDFATKAEAEAFTQQV